MEDRTGGIERLQLVLHIERGENILGIADGQVRGVGVIRRLALLSCSDDIGEVLLVMLGKTVSGGLGRRRFEVIQISVLLLIVGQAGTHMVQHFDGKILRLFVGHVLAQPFRVQTDLIHTDQTERREVIIKGAEVALGVGIQPLLHQAGDHGALDLETARGNIHQMIEALVEFLRCLGEISDLRHVDRNYTDGAGGFAAAEEAAGLFAQLAQVETQAAAHRAHIARLHIAVDIVGEIGSAIFCRHLKEQLVVLRLRPIKVAGDGVGGDGILESAPVGVAFDHDLNEGAVDHIHFLLAVFVLKGHLLAAHDCGQLRHIIRNGPVQGDIGERRLRAPPGGGVHAVYKGLDTLFHLIEGKIVYLDKGCKISIE